MKWYKDLYIGEEAGKKKSKLIKQLEQKKLTPGVFVITLASNGKDLLDVLPGIMMLKEQCRQREILGLAVTKEEALEVCEQIILDVYQKTSAYAVRSFFE